MMKRRYFYYSVPFLLIVLGFHFLKDTHNKSKPPINNGFSTFTKATNFDDGDCNRPANEHYPNLDNELGSLNSKHDNDDELKDIKKSSLQAYFSPRDDIRSIIIKYILDEKKEIICAAFRLTDTQITKALFEAYNRGVKLIFIVDREGLSAMNSKLLHFINAGIPIYFFPPLEDLTTNHSIGGLMHNKIMSFVGQKVILTGSFNFTKSAQDRNRENILVIKNNDEVFNRYMAELKLLKSESSLLQGNKIPSYVAPSKKRTKK
jgi:phosphatidylserine/phosphatidylglycerophosphate/cardiolipin synthase-like enzyme